MRTKSVRELGAAIREARVARGQTQRAVATRIHVSQSAISKVEKGFPGASIGLIFQILKALDIPLELGDDGRPSRPKAAHTPSETIVDLDAIADTGLRRP